MFDLNCSTIFYSSLSNAIVFWSVPSLFVKQAKLLPIDWAVDTLQKLKAPGEGTRGVRMLKRSVILWLENNGDLLKQFKLKSFEWVKLIGSSKLIVMLGKMLKSSPFYESVNYGI